VSEVDEALVASRAAHATYRQLSTLYRRDLVACAVAIDEAATARRLALSLDPAMTDPAWSDDRAQNRGVASGELLAFYDEILSRVPHPELQDPVPGEEA